METCGQPVHNVGWSIRTMQQEVVTEALKASPAIGVVVAHKIAGFQINEWVGLVTCAYIVLQAAYLVWKWVREARRKGEEDAID